MGLFGGRNREIKHSFPIQCRGKIFGFAIGFCFSKNLLNKRLLDQTVELFQFFGVIQSSFENSRKNVQNGKA
ncbi:hypothetical protein SAMN05444412_104309 [Rhodonellum ikkaensis]|uniref:Ribosomal protein L32 n=1 Tax=Rhodonellum ikkaensis TaxID=336829 RepID=A0A1H3PJY7_9BACT|nr:hypothetical protein SAMN05444412_104309 [Rhodonellum ikkaensis]